MSKQNLTIRGGTRRWFISGWKVAQKVTRCQRLYWFFCKLSRVDFFCRFPWVVVMVIAIGGASFFLFLDLNKQRLVLTGGGKFISDVAVCHTPTSPTNPPNQPLVRRWQCWWWLPSHPPAQPIPVTRVSNGYGEVQVWYSRSVLPPAYSWNKCTGD